MALVVEEELVRRGAAFGLGPRNIALGAAALRIGDAVSGGIGAAAFGGSLSAISLAVSVLATVISTWSTRFGSAA